METTLGSAARVAYLPEELEPLHKGVRVEADGCMVIKARQQAEEVDAHTDNQHRPARKKDQIWQPRGDPWAAIDPHSRRIPPGDKWYRFKPNLHPCGDRGLQQAHQLSKSDRKLYITINIV